MSKSGRKYREKSLERDRDRAKKRGDDSRRIRSKGRRLDWNQERDQRQPDDWQDRRAA